MRRYRALLLGLTLLVAAQLLASLALTPLRRQEVRSSEAGFTAVTPGEFAGTLMLGGFRGLACDMLWVRADTAQEQGKFYESQALFSTISRIQPGFIQIWSYLSWNMAYNIGHEVEDPESQWAWMLSGIEVNVQGCERNPQSEQLLNHLAWMFNHRGDQFHVFVEKHDWQPLLGPLIGEVNQQLPTAQRLPRFPSGSGLTNFRIAAILYDACVRLRDVQHRDPTTHLLRLWPLAIECDGDLSRNRGEHLAALGIWLESLQVWSSIHARYASPFSDAGQEFRRQLGLESWVRNEGQLRRKASEMARQLALDAATGERLASEIMNRSFTEAAATLAHGGFAQRPSYGRIQWLDEH